MSTSGSANLAKIDLDNAAQFPNNVLVINLGAAQLGSYDGFDIEIGDPGGLYAGFDVTVYIQPDLATPDQLALSLSGATAASGGDDTIELVAPLPGSTDFVPIKPVVTGGPGNDTFTTTSIGSAMIVTAYGGSGDDMITGGPANDTLRGDYLDDGSISPAGILTLNVPAAAEGQDQLFGGDGDDTLHGDGGDDRLFGQKGADTLYGDGGNDFLDGGPRGEGYLDVLTGGTGADAFILNYTQGSSGGTSFWSQYVSTDLGTTALDEVKSILETASKDALEEALGKLVAGLVLTGIGDGLGVLLETFIEDLLDTPKPQSKEDVLVVTDFDPSEDTLFLPIETGLTLTATPTYFANSASGATGWGIAYTDGTSGDLFAEVFLDTTSYLPALGITNDQPDPNTEAEVKQIIGSVLSTSVQITPGGIQNLSSITELSAEGVLQAATKSGTTVQVFGALGPMTVVNPDDGSPLVAAGTAYGDYLTVNSQAVLPENWQPSALYAATGRSLIRGFAGDDLLYGGAGPDVIYGDEGDDDIYGFFPVQQSALLEADDLMGGAGDDLIVTGMSLADVDGGTGTDTLSFRYSTLPVTVDLSTGIAFDGIGTAEKPNYTIAHIENVIGSPNADTITGNAEDNTIDGAGGTDNLDGGDGTDTLSFASIAGGISVDLTAGAAKSVATTGPALAYTFQNFANVIGTTAADTITGDAGDNVIDGAGGADQLDGGAGNDLLVMTAYTGGLTVDLANGTASGGGADGMAVANFESVIGVADGDNTLFATAEADARSSLTGATVATVVQGGKTVEIFDIFVPNAAPDQLTSAAHGVTVDYSGSPDGVTVDLGSTGPQSGGWAQGDTYAFANAERGTLTGSAFADRLTGNGGVALFGGPGADIFAVGTGSNVAMDFTYKDGDKIDLTAYGITTLQELENRFSVLELQPNFYALIAGNETADAFEFQSIDGAFIPVDSYILAPAAPGLFTATADELLSIELIGKYAAYDNALGIFEIMSDDTIGAVDILIPSSKALDLGSRIVLDTIELGDRFGFFLVQDHPLDGQDGSFALQNARTGGSLALADLLDSGTAIGLAFTDSGGDTGSIDAKVFLSTDLGDGREQVRTTEQDDGSTLLVFEDQDRAVASDHDFNDLEILITTATTDQV